MGVKFTNNAATTLAANINNSATSTTVASSSTFPSISGSNYFYATFDDGTNNEVVKVTAVSGTTWTIVRAQDDTSARAFTSGDTVELRLNVALLEDALGDAATFARDSFTGDGSDTTFTLSQTAASENNLIVFIEGVFQTQSAYSLSGTTLTFSAAPASSREIIVYSTQALSAGTVTTAAIIDANVTTAKIADDAVTAAKLASDAVVTASIVDANVTTAKLAADAVTAAKLADNAVVTANITNDNVTQGKIADDAVGADQLAASAVVTASMVDDAVTTAKIADDQVTAAKIADNSITNALMADDAIDSAEIADGAVDTVHIADLNVTTAKIAADAITGAKIADDTIDSEHYAAGSIDLEHMSSQSVDEDNLYISNAGSNGQFLSKQSGNSGGLTWAAAGGTITALNNATANELVTIGSTTTELDAEANLTFDGSALQVTGTVTVGVNDTGHDVKFFGATASSYMLWDESADLLKVEGDLGTNNPGITINNTSNAVWTQGFHHLLPNIATGTEAAGISVGKNWGSYNASKLGFYYAGDGSTSNLLTLGFHSRDKALTIAAGTGYVGIGMGTSVPNNFLHVYGNDNQLSIDGASGANSALFFREAGTNKWELYHRGASDDFRIYNFANTSFDFTITSAGNVGIGTTSPSSKLHVDGSITSNDLFLTNEGKDPNHFDGTTGSWQIQEGSNDLFIMNKITGKKYKFKLEEI